MQDSLEEILSLQLEYSPLNTPKMQRRGELIRSILPAEISRNAPAIAAALGEFGDDLKVVGRDATGRKALVPWTRVFSKRMSPKPGSGWYIVYLFHSDASGVSVCLSHGSTSPIDGGYKRHEKSEIDQLMSWARGVLGGALSVDRDFQFGVSLGKEKLASAYEKTTVLSKFYPREAIPSDEDLTSDLIRLGRLLGKLYAAQETGQASPFSAPLGHTGRSTHDTLPSEIDDTDSGYPIDDTTLVIVAEPIDPTDARQRIAAQIFVRQGGGAFRNEALKRFNSRCAVSGWDVRQVLEAAHIVPYRGKHTNTADNALLLRADLHTLFDCDLLRIDPDTLRVRLSDTLAAGPYAAFEGKEIALPAGVSQETLRSRLLERAEAMGVLIGTTSVKA